MSRETETKPLPVADVIDETPNVRTFRLDNRTARWPVDLPGRFVKLRVEIDGEEHWRSFSISSAPTDARTLDLTIKHNRAGIVSPHLFAHALPGTVLHVTRPRGRFTFHPEFHREPLVLLSAGIGITPVASIARFLESIGDRRPRAFLHGARTVADIPFHREWLDLATRRDAFRYHVTLSEPHEGWVGAAGRLDPVFLERHVPDLAARRYFLSGPGSFVEDFRGILADVGVPDGRVHFERFHSAPSLVTT